jgi:polyisoprenoid-binding protein YceI
MKKLMLLAAFAGLGLSVLAGPPKKIVYAISGTYNVDAPKSTFKWNAKKVVGEHSGTVAYQAGNITINANKLAGADITIDMASIDCTDLSGEYHDKLVGHLKADDFFATEKFNTAKIKIKSASEIKGAATGSNNYNVVADLTIKGITKEISFPAFVVINPTQVIANAELDIDRTAFEIKYGSASFFEGLGDRAIANTFNVKVRIVANK